MSGWNTAHNPNVRPLGCNGKYGASGYKAHKRRGTAVCGRCLTSQRHYRAEVRRGQPKPRRLKPCGTWAAAARHRHNNEPLDFACSVAEAEYQQGLRDKRKELASAGTQDMAP